jgi:predicted TIM-barrel fold metal-dependent hydrolase
MICDSHIHFIPESLSIHTSFYKGIWTDKNRLYEHLDKNDIEKALLVYPSTDAHLKLGERGVCEVYNSEVANAIKENPKIIGAGIVDFGNLSDICDQVSSLKDKGFKAVSIASSYNGKFMVEELRPLFEAAESINFPIFVHPQTINPIGFDRVKDPLLMPVLEYSFDASMFMGLLMMQGVLGKTKTRFIFSSLGGIIPFLKDRFDRVYEMLRKREIVKDLGLTPSEIFKNVYVDTSGASLKNIELAIDLFGVDKILWGSDYPVSGDIKGYLKMLDSFGPSIKEKIISRNFNSIF